MRYAEASSTPCQEIFFPKKAVGNSCTADIPIQGWSAPRRNLPDCLTRAVSIHGLPTTLVYTR